MTQAEKDMNTSINVQASFSSTISKSQLPDALTDITESSIDGLLDNPIVAQIPIVKTIAGMIQMGANIHDRLFLKKILTLLQGIEDIPAQERYGVINEIDSSEKYQIKVGEKLLYILDTCDDYINSKNVAKLFAAMLRRKITYDQYVGAAQIVARTSQPELDQFIDAYKYFSVDDSAASLGHTGLIYSDTSEVEVEVDLNKVEQGDWDDPPEHYEADTNTFGGETVYHSTQSGDVIFEVFGIGKDALRKQWEEEAIKKKEEVLKKNRGNES